MDNFTDHSDKKIKDGFMGQRLLVLPNEIVKNLQSNPFTQPLYFTHIGFFPSAKNHFVERTQGSADFILIYCLEGEGWYVTKNVSEQIEQDEFFVLPAKEYHNYGSSKTKPWSIYFLHFNGLLAERFYQKMADQRKSKIAPLKERNRLFDYLYNVIDTGYSNYNLEHVNMSLWHLLNTFIYNENFKIETKESIGQLSVNNASVKATISFMKNNLDKKISLGELAQVANLSVSRFSNVFKEATGYAPNDYFIRLKIQKACQYLDLTDKRIKTISHLIGIEDPYYFSRLFKKIMGKSPLEYRNFQK
mgnify:CR=1 FL=1